MSWNYRIIRSENEGDVFYQMHEAYYEDGKDTSSVPNSWSEKPIDPLGNKIEELKDDIEYMLLAFDKPILQRHKDPRIEKLVEVKDVT